MTRRFQLIALLAVMMWLPAVASDNTDIKLWSNGPLTWGDFHKLLPPTSSEASHIEVELSATPLTDGNQSGARLEARAIMHRNTSATSTAQSTPERLRYHQLQFDLLVLQ